MKALDVPFAFKGRLINASPHFLSWLLQLDGGSGEFPAELSSPDRLAALRDHDITPWLYRRVMQEGRQEALDPEVTALLRHDYIASLALTMAQEEETCQILAALTSAGLEPILLKGADLRLRVYEDPATRPMSDLDLLLSREEAARAQAVFLKLGYRLCGHGESRSGLRQQYGHELEFLPPDAKVLLVDLHWEIRGAACVHSLAYEPLRAQAVPWRYREIPVHLLAPEHALLHICLHTFSEAEISLKAVLDLALVLTRLPLSWDRFRDEVYRFRCQLPVAAILGKMATLGPGLVPADLLKELARYRPSAQERLILGLRHYLRRLGAGLPLLNRHRHLWEGATFILARLRKKF